MAHRQGCCVFSQVVRHISEDNLMVKNDPYGETNHHLSMGLWCVDFCAEQGSVDFRNTSLGGLPFSFTKGRTCFDKVILQNARRHLIACSTQKLGNLPLVDSSAV